MKVGRIVVNTGPAATRNSTSKRWNTVRGPAAEVGYLLFRESLGVMIRVTCYQHIFS